MLSQWQKGEYRKTASTVKSADAWAVEWMRLAGCRHKRIQYYIKYTGSLFLLR
jgi:hypothetical protein